MRIKNHSIYKYFQASPFLRSYDICKSISYTLHTYSSSSSCNWMRENELIQRHPILQLVEQHCLKFLQNIKHVLPQIVVSGLHRNPFVVSRLVYLTLIESKQCNVEEEYLSLGVKIFDLIEKPNVFTWNTMIRFFAEYDHTVSLKYYTRARRRDVCPDKYTYTFVIQACGAGYDLSLLRQVHCHVMKLGFDRDLFVQNSLVSCYFTCGGCGSSMDARLVFDEMPVRDIVSWTSLISGFVSQGSYGEALSVFKQLLGENCCEVEPNVATIVSTVSACCGLGSISVTKCWHGLLEKGGWLERDVSIVNSLIDACVKCGDLDYGREIFDDLRVSNRNLYSWTAIISGYAMHGRGIDALELFSQMEQTSGLKPDNVFFITILSACAHSGLIQEGLQVFELMSEKYGIDPDLRHYGCIVDLWGRVGMIDQAYYIVDNMPMEPNLAVLGSLLSGCRLHNNLEIGEAVLKKIESLKEKHGGAPILLSNIYANEKQWSKVMDIRKEIRGTIMPVKPPGRSWIHVKDTLHEFVAQNEADPLLHIVLEGLEKHSRL